MNQVNSPRAWHAIGVDIGGTTTRAALIGEGGVVVDARRAATGELQSFAGLIEWLTATNRAFRLRADHVVSRPVPVGLAVPGLPDERRATVRRSVNVPWLEGVPLAHATSDALNAHVRLVTDAEAAAWGEYAARRRAPERFAHLRIGTGIALGVIVDGALVELDQERSGHLDVLIVDRSDNARECPCGLRGCLESVASGAALRRTMQARAVGNNLAGLGIAAIRGDRESIALLDATATAISIAIGNIMARWHPSVIALGGGVLNAIPSLVDRVGSEWRNRAGTNREAVSLMIEPAFFGDDAGVVGAGLLAQEAVRTRIPSINGIE